MLSDVSLTKAGKFPGKYKKAKQRIKVNAHTEEIFYFSKRGHLCRCRYLTVPLLSQPRPRALFTGFGGDSCRAPTSKAREKRPGDEVVVIFDLRHPGPIISFTSRVLYFS